MKKIILAAILTMFAAGSAYADLQCTCSDCHGNPPSVSTFGPPNGLAGVGVTSGAHLAHTNGSFGGSANPMCFICHYDGMPQTSFCGNLQLQVGFSGSALGNKPNATGMTYDGLTSISPSWSYSGTNGATITQNGTMVCSGIYCHSNGTGGTLNTNTLSQIPPLSDPRPISNATSPAWSTQSTIGCNACHGYPPSYAEGAPKANRHLRHSAFTTCDYCHYGTTTDGTTITNPSLHVNGRYDVTPNTNVLWGVPPYTVPVDFVYAYDTSGGRCSSNSCHYSMTITSWRDTSVDRDFQPAYTYTNGPACYMMNFSLSCGGGVQPCTYLIDFGDMSQPVLTTNTSTSHTFPGGSNYTVTLQARDSKGILGMPPASGSIKPQPTNTGPIANFTATAQGCVVTLTDLSTDVDANTCGHSGCGQIKITWGDGSPVEVHTLCLGPSPSNQQFTHTYRFNSTYWVNDKVVDNSNTSNSISKQVPACQ